MKNSTRTLTVVFCFLISTASLFAKNSYDSQTSPQASGTTPGPNVTNVILPFYLEDFAGGLPSSWKAIDSVGNGLNWKYTTTHSKDGSALSSTGTSASNGYMLYDSDSAGGLHGVDKADLISGPVDCSTHPNVHLNFNEFLVHFNDTALVYISTDSVNWTQVYESSLGMVAYQATSNPHNVDLDISSLAANQDSVYIRFSYHADYAFYWMIDDVILHEVAQQDAMLSSITAPGSSCTLLTNSEPVSVSIFNSGGATITTCLVTYVVDGGTPVTDTVNASIAIGATHPYTFTTNADFSTPGTHIIQAYVTLTGDTNAVNDSAMATIFNGSHVIDAGNSYQIGFESTEDLSTTSFQDANLDAITWVLDSTFQHSGNMCALLQAPIADDWIFTPCLSLDSGAVYGLSYFSKRLSTSLQANLQIGIGNVQNPGGMGQIIFNNSPVTNVIYTQSYHLFTVQTTGIYYIGFEISNADSAVGFAIDDINIGVDNGNGILTNLNDKVSVFPNPSNGLVYLNSELQPADGFVVQITNTMGELVNTVKTESLNNYKLDLSSYSAGIYIVRVISANGISTQKINLNK